MRRELGVNTGEAEEKPKKEGKYQRFQLEHTALSAHSLFMQGYVRVFVRAHTSVVTIEVDERIACVCKRETTCTSIVAIEVNQSVLVLQEQPQDHVCRHVRHIIGKLPVVHYLCPTRYMLYE